MTRQSYLDRITRVIDHIHVHAHEPLPLDVLAEVAAMSPHHWHRVWHAMTGETCARTVRRIRLHRAATRLIETDDPPDAIARAVGYPVMRSFTRAFADRYGCTPAEFRNRGAAPPRETHDLKNGDTAMYDIDLTDEPARRLAVLRHAGAYPEISRTFAKLSAVIAERGNWADVRGMGAVYHDDPMATPEPDLQSDAGAILADGAPLPEGLTELALPAGRHARLVFRGAYAGLGRAYDHLYGTWLPASGETPADFPPYEIYVNSPMDTAPDDLVTHILVPLR